MSSWYRLPGYRLFRGFAVMLVANGVLAAAEPPAKPPHAVNYGRPFEPPTRPALIPLPPGAVEPDGWLRDWCLAARDGYTGHMDEYDAEFKRAWAADHKMTGDRLNWPKGAWPYEGGGYWFDGLVRLGYVLHDDALLATGEEAARRGRRPHEPQRHPVPVVAQQEQSRRCEGDHLRRRLAHLGLRAAGPRAWRPTTPAPETSAFCETLEAGYSGDRDWVRLGGGMSNPWPAFQTYTWTGNKEIAEALTTLFSKDGGGKDTPQGVLEPLPPHAQRRNRGPRPTITAWFSSKARRPGPWATCGRATASSSTRPSPGTTCSNAIAMQPSGVPVADEYYGPTGAFRGTETCDVAGYLWSQIVLLTVSGQGRMADRAERAFFNAGPATVARDFKTHVYFQSPNRIVDSSPPCPHGPGASGCSYKPTHFPLCCTAALNRILPNYVMHMWMATYDNGLAATHYGPCKVSALAADRVPVEIVCRTDYPFNEVIEMSVKPAREATFPLSFRIPGWCKNPELSVNGSGVKAAPDAKGFVRVERLWKPGDAIRLRFPMSVSVKTGRDSNAQGAPYASVSYGPLLFALPIPDTQGPNTPDPAAKWKYALDVQGEKLEARHRRGASGDARQMGLAAGIPAQLQAAGASIDWNPEPQTPRLPAEPIAKSGPAERITLIPYGCTKFRISMFPVTQRLLEITEAKQPSTHPQR